MSKKDGKPWWKTKWGIAIIVVAVLVVIGAAMGAGGKDAPGSKPSTTPSTSSPSTPSETDTPSETATPSEAAEEVKPGELDHVEAQTYCGEAWKKQLALEYDKYKVSEVFGAKATKITSTGKWAVVLPGKVNGAKFTFYCNVGGTDDSPEVELVGMR